MHPDTNHFKMVHSDPLVSQMVTQMNRIEQKVDDMQSALLTMARTEERVTQLMLSDTKKTEWIMKLQDRIVELEKTDVGQRAVSSRVERAIWIVVTLLLTSAIGYIFASGGV